MYRKESIIADPGVSFLQIFTFDTSTQTAGAHNNITLASSSPWYGSESGSTHYVTLNASPGHHITEISGSSQVSGSGWGDSVPSVLSITGEEPIP